MSFLKIVALVLGVLIALVVPVAWIIYWLLGVSGEVVLNYQYLTVIMEPVTIIYLGVCLKSDLAKAWKLILWPLFLIHFLAIFSAGLLGTYILIVNRT